MSNVTWYQVLVKDSYGEYDEEVVTTVKQEAETWFKQWKEEYPKDDGYKVTLCTSLVKPGYKNE